MTLHLSRSSIMRGLPTSVLILFPVAASAQSGVILFDRAVRYDFAVREDWNLPDEIKVNIPAAKFTYMLLLFNESASLMIPAPTEEEEPLTGMAQRARGLAERMRMNSASRSDQETLLEVYVNNEEGTVAETREFMGRTFLLTGTRPAYEWRLSREQSQFLGYTVQKATAVQDSSAIEAWFTPEIPVSAGPGLFGGLPGMILAVSVDSGHTVYSATEINLTSVEHEAIRPPKGGQKVSHDEYEQIVAEKLEEMRMIRSRPRVRRP